MDDAQRPGCRRTSPPRPRKAPVAVVEDMSWEEFSGSTCARPELPGVTADMGEVRVYPFSGAFAHVIGYVAKVAQEDVTKTGPNADPILLNPGFRIGKQGMEKPTTCDLRGKAGAQEGRGGRQRPRGRRGSRRRHAADCRARRSA